MKINYTLGGVILFIISIISIYYLSIWTYLAWTTYKYNEYTKELSDNCVFSRIMSLLGWLLITIIYLGPCNGIKHFTKKRTINLNFKL